MHARFPLRKDVPTDEKWDLSYLVKDEAQFEASLQQLGQDVDAFVTKWQGKITTAQDVAQAIIESEKLSEGFVTLGSYAELDAETDQTNDVAQIRVGNYGNFASKAGSKLSFVNSEILALTNDVLEEAITIAPNYTHYINLLIKKKAHQLHPEAERTIAALSETLNAPYSLYNTAKLVDLQFENFEVNGKSYPLNYNLFEGDWELEVDTDVRRAAFDSFSQQVKHYLHTTAKTYSTHVQQEKTLSELRGYDSVFDYLLDEQEVDRDLYNRQIDVTMKELAPHMRRYAKLLQKVHGLEKMTFADLKISLDPEFEPSITVEQSRKYLNDALGVMGEDYLQMISDSFDQRWIDFAKNEGKSTGAFCASPYGSHSYILISWTSRMNEVFVLAHELGHAGHFRNSNRAQTLYNSESSTYFVEAPSTMNEMLMANHLLSTSKDARFKRWVISSIVARTYYHNFVTHLLEAAFQRKVYEIVDAGGSLTASKLNDLKRSVLEEFWGDAVEINDGAELTWMRQPHYYMGLYPYTYSAGLTISTEVSQRILKEGKPAVADWLATLKAGGTKTPVELAQMAGVDITTDQPLQNTIAFIGDMIEQLEQLTAEIAQ
ncbi:oligoendopeptidase F [Kurthia sibirica]|uniref:Oligopeptidase F n=1 Tax=Kurthia sibirica TaxID=202750 RepID=A0A2U3APL8_9BACL|nr:oligoendopeptidase F [Kurthia sibirica]PWI26481.1 oligoendopeptidase F [Kurthia sibirica]GEK33050.1 oligoendopeptidase F [Kurthia sibirica]